VSQAADLLLECHARIRAFLATARRIAEARDAPPGEVAEAARAVHRYFTMALPLHVVDEERSVLPRLRGRSAEIDAALAAMVAEHQGHLGPLAELVAACATLSATPDRHGELAPGLLVTLGCLEPQLQSHLVAEESVVISGMRRWLSPQEDAAVVAEVRWRRAAPTGPEEPPRTPSRA
jgi:iron-sulfur cluster repair protein YtfE (RIC family)